MTMRAWMRLVLVCGLAVAVSTGCRWGKKRGTTGTGVDANIAGIQGSVIGEGGEFGMDANRLEGEEMRNQFSPIYFDYDSSQVGPAERAKVEAVAEYLRGQPASGVVVEGHTDERGSNEYNLALGERRALAVRAYLIGLGIEAARVQTKSFGEESPVAMGHGEESWKLNRRGEFAIIK